MCIAINSDTCPQRSLHSESCQNAHFVAPSGGNVRSVENLLGHFLVPVRRKVFTPLFKRLKQGRQVQVVKGPFTHCCPGYRIVKGGMDEAIIM